ncbi:MAG: hypothetical protein DUD27_01465 [Lachnospiraceae bacterium]|uniref:V-type proton ATPase subunit E n=1 Tax=Candidatus Weimeria bifida TaxID=2599074 RepID=A0A6N7IZS3_9FIRM|nr:hypothetical protein [Candidatus Weimeria bifida]RRF97256.1 MAG: hypothetical protein DUD27_01465 [Lachnospiraceae bacterium]
MTGLDKIINEIKEESDQTTAEILKNGRDKADEFSAAAEKETAAAEKEINDRADLTVKQIRQRAADGADMIKKRAVLEAKQEIIKETLDEAKQKLYDMPSSEYAAFLEKLIIKNADQGEGVLSIGKDDKSRLPADFTEKVSAKLPDGKTLKASDKTADIDHGVILAYEGSAENLSIDELFASKNDELTDIVKDILF